MLSRRFLTSSLESDRPNLICDLRFIFGCMKASKSKYGYLSMSDNTLYCTGEEQICVHKIEMPFLVNTDLVIATNIDSYRVLDKYDQFFIPSKYPWMALPMQYWETYKADLFYIQMNTSTGYYELYNALSHHKSEDVIYFNSTLHDVSIKQALFTIENFRNSFVYSRNNWDIKTSIKDFQTNEKFSYGFFDQKTTYGSFVIPINIDGRDVPFFFYKAMIALNKSDNLTLNIYQNRLDRSIYIMEFIPIKKKDPLGKNIYGVPYRDLVYFCCKDIS